MARPPPPSVAASSADWIVTCSQSSQTWISRALAGDRGESSDLFTFTGTAGFDRLFPDVFDDPLIGPRAIVHGEAGAVETPRIDVAGSALVPVDSLRFRPRFDAWSASFVDGLAWLSTDDSLYVAEILPGARIGRVTRPEAIGTTNGPAVRIPGSNRVALPCASAGLVVYTPPEFGAARMPRIGCEPRFGWAMTGFGGTDPLFQVGASGGSRESKRREPQSLHGRGLFGSRGPRWRPIWSPEPAQEAVWVSAWSFWMFESAQAAIAAASWSIRVSESAQAAV